MRKELLSSLRVPAPSSGALCATRILTRKYAACSDGRLLNESQLLSELQKCSTCQERPCMKACPVSCDPSSFIKIVKDMASPSDWRHSAAEIMSMNPFGGTCGAVCPDKFCMNACVRKDIDGPVNIPAVQSTIIHNAYEAGVFPKWSLQPSGSLRNKKVGIVGAGPSGLACAAWLVRQGVPVTVFEKRSFAGGQCNIIPDHRLPKMVLERDIEFLKSLGSIDLKYDSEIKDPVELLKRDGFSAVCVAVGLDKPKSLNVEGEEQAVDALSFLWNPEKYDVKGKRIAVVGGGAVAVDVATSAKRLGAEEVTLFYRRSMKEMPLTQQERDELVEHGVNVVSHSLPVKISVDPQTREVKGLVIRRVGGPRSPKSIPKGFIDGSDQQWNDVNMVVYAIGNVPALSVKQHEGLFYAGDIVSGASTVVEASAYGKSIGAAMLDFLHHGRVVMPEKPTKSETPISGYNFEPVDLTADFFGMKIINPFIVSASPLTDGYEQCKKAYDAGWAGVVMKTAFDDLPIHIPNRYMFLMNGPKVTGTTYGNCDNVSDHPLSRVCKEIAQLRKEYPDRLTMGSTGGPVTGDDAADKLGWQSNTKKLEDAGAMAIEYSLSCPQGGDGTEGSIVSQNAALSAKIIEWVLEKGDGDVPKLFKLTGAVTSIVPILRAIKEVFDKYPGKKAGVTLANSFPSLSFRNFPGSGSEWEKGVVVGMSGDGVTPVSYLTLADASSVGVTISGNGGPFDYMAACNFLALGCGTVQFCTLPTKYGVRSIDLLVRGTSHLLQYRGIRSIKELIGKALPEPVMDFMKLTPVKQISSVNPDLCVHCGNCTDCPYLAIELNSNGIPVIDPSRCIGCGVCTMKCPSIALTLRNRTKQELEVLQE